MFRKIQALYDFSPSGRNALEAALRLSVSTRADLKVTHAVFPAQPGSAADGALLGRLTDHIRADIEKELGRHPAKKSSGIGSVEIKITDGPVIPSLLREISVQCPDLVILGSHGLTGLAHVLLGNVAEKIIRHSPCPVWVCRKEARVPPRKILIPVDLKGPPSAALDFARGLSRISPDTEVELLHVIQLSELIGQFPDAFGGRITVDPAILEKKAAAELAAIARECPELRIRYKARLGQAAIEIQSEAIEGRADLILMPSHGRTGMGHLLMGSVAEQVARYARCDVLVFCPKETAERRRAIIDEIKVE